MIFLLLLNCKLGVQTLDDRGYHTSQEEESYLDDLNEKIEDLKESKDPIQNIKFDATEELVYLMEKLANPFVSARSEIRELLRLGADKDITFKREGKEQNMLYAAISLQNDEFVDLLVNKNLMIYPSISSKEFDALLKDAPKEVRDSIYFYISHQIDFNKEDEKDKEEDVEDSPLDNQDNIDDLEEMLDKEQNMMETPQEEAPIERDYSNYLANFTTKEEFEAFKNRALSEIDIFAAAVRGAFNIVRQKIALTPALLTSVDENGNSIFHHGAVAFNRNRTGLEDEFLQFVKEQAARSNEIRGFIRNHVNKSHFNCAHHALFNRRIDLFINLIKVLFPSGDKSAVPPYRTRLQRYVENVEGSTAEQIHDNNGFANTSISLILEYLPKDLAEQTIRGLYELSRDRNKVVRINDFSFLGKNEFGVGEGNIPTANTQRLNPALRGYRRISPIHTAAYFLQDSSLRFLLDEISERPEENVIANSIMGPPLSCLLRRAGNEVSVNSIFDYFYRINDEIGSSEDEDVNELIPIHWAVVSSYFDILYKIYPAPSFPRANINNFLTAGSNENMAPSNSKGFTPFHLATLYLDVEALAVMMQKCFDTVKVNDDRDRGAFAVVAIYQELSRQIEGSIKISDLSSIGVDSSLFSVDDINMFTSASIASRYKNAGSTGDLINRMFSLVSLIVNSSDVLSKEIETLKTLVSENLPKNLIKRSIK